MEQKEDPFKQEKLSHLKEYIQEARSHGANVNQIRKLLLDSKWSEQLIDEAFGIAILEKAKLADSTADSGRDLISFKDVTKSFGDNLVLSNVNLTIKKGEIFGVIGLSGSGKTTLLNALIGFVNPEHGEILYSPEKDFISIFEENADIKRRFGFASQEPSFYFKLTARENLELFGNLYNLPKETIQKNTDTLLRLMGLFNARNTLAQDLSGGMQKRLDIACALMHDPEVLILDEPTSDLDPFLRREMWNLIQKINEKGTTIILASHFLDELETLCNRVGLLHNRRIIHEGPSISLRQSYSKEQEIRLKLKSEKYDEISRRLAPHVTTASKKDDRLVIFSNNPNGTLKEIIKFAENSNEEIDDISVSTPHLSEVFEHLVENEKNT